MRWYRRLRDLFKNVRKNTNSIVVIGMGGLGLLAINAAKNLNIKKIIAVDISDKKLKFAKKFGATNVFNLKKIMILINI